MRRRLEYASHVRHVDPDTPVLCPVSAASEHVFQQSKSVAQNWGDQQATRMQRGKTNVEQVHAQPGAQRQACLWRVLSGGRKRISHEHSWVYASHIMPLHIWRMSHDKHFHTFDKPSVTPHFLGSLAARA